MILQISTFQQRYVPLLRHRNHRFTFKLECPGNEYNKLAAHGATEQGESLSTILEMLDALVEEASLLVAHNMKFDEKIIGAEFIRNSMKNTLSSKPKLCTMESATDFCRLPSRYGYKWPKLSELHYKLFRTPFEDAHNAAVDIEVTAKCFWELKRLKVIL